LSVEATCCEAAGLSASFAASSRILFWKSSDAFLNSASPLPRDLAISGSFAGPITISAITRIMISSGIPIPNIFVPLEDNGGV